MDYPSALITGGAGFVGHHLVEHLLLNTDWNLVCLDRLDTSGNLNRLDAVIGGSADRKERVRFIYHDLKAPISPTLSQQIGNVDYIFHLAAGTHVDRSITDPMSFVYDNVVGTGHLLEYARTIPHVRMINFSTDEVFGPAPKHIFFAENDRYRAGNPYAATKAGAEQLCLAYHNTYGVNVIITHCMNIFGERQHVEKFIPLCVKRLLSGKEIEIHANKTKKKSGSRFYIHARNVASAALFIMRKGAPGEMYNIVGEKEVTNLSLANTIARLLFVPDSRKSLKLIDYHSSRPGHDLRYALDGTKLAALGWTPQVSFEASLSRTVRWMREHPEWLL